jgi:hypothetical protein
MPNSLIPDFPITTSEAPRSSLSKSDIAAPMRDMAEALDKSGAALTDVATDVAERAGEEAGRKSVRVDDAGNLVVDDTRNPFIIGQAAKAYERAAKMSQVAQIEPKVQTDILGLRLAHPNEPALFLKAAKDYADGILNGDPDSNTSGIQDPHIRGVVGDILNTTTQHNLRTSLIDANQQNTAETLQNYQARIKGLTEEMDSLARQGAGTAPVGSDAYKTFQSKANDLATLYNELQRDNRFKFSAERAKLEVDEHYAGFKVQDVIGKVQRQFMEDRDLAKATETLQNAFWGEGSEKLGLTARQRDHGVSEGLAHLRNLAVQDHEAITENRKAVAGFAEQTFTNPRNFDIGQLNNLRQRAESIGDRRSVAALDELREIQPLASALHSATPQGRSDMLGQMKAGVTPFFRLQSSFDKMMADAPPDVRAGVSIFSGMRTTEHQAELWKAAVAKYGSEEEARKWVAPPGHSQHEKGNAADLRYATPEARQWIHDNADKYGLKFPLANEPWHIETADARTGGGLVEGQKVDLAAANSAGRMFETLTKNLQGIVSKDAVNSLDRIEKNAKEGAAVLPDDVQLFLQQATRSGRDDLIEKGATWIAALDKFNNLPAGTTYEIAHSQVQELRSKGVEPIVADTLDHFDALVKAHDERFNQNPRAEAAAAGWTGAPQPLSFSAADSGQLADRQKSNQVIAQHVPNVGAIPVIMPGEARQLATVLTTGDPKQASQFLSTLRTSVPLETYRTTLESDPVKAAVINMFNSNVPERLDAAGRALEQLWDTNSQDFEAKFGGHTADRVSQWKALQSVDPETRAKRLSSIENKQNEKELAEKVEKEIKDLTPQKVADSLGNFFQRNVPFVHGPLPQDLVRGNELAEISMKNDFKRAYSALREVGTNPADAQTIAVQRISAQWKPSQLMGGALMKNAPESFYPADPLSKDHAWMIKQLKAEIEAIHGPELAAVGEGVTAGWSLRGIVADAQTQREIEAGKPPSYQVHIADANGQDQIFGGVGKRYVWDPKAMIAGAAATTEARIRRRETETSLFEQRMRNRQLGFNPALGGEIPGGGGVP